MFLIRMCGSGVLLSIAWARGAKMTLPKSHSYYQYIVTTVVNMTEGWKPPCAKPLGRGKQERWCVIEWREEESLCVGEERSQGRLTKGGHVKACVSWMKVRGVRSSHEQSRSFTIRLNIVYMSHDFDL
ncbi:hypothetical protein B0F90DRAFT_402874 [Multifurca ochricompacta]|uniref:Secreted protein n=1 Tax=Multifurca ochricompacta TaxID=376703 RepID=A0AAD4QJ54_9AGAM|nr:hypothetical protein B0F90DRAFT_402874 [Multifurca ochricompacta]